MTYLRFSYWVASPLYVTHYSVSCSEVFNRFNVSECAPYVALWTFRKSSFSKISRFLWFSIPESLVVPYWTLGKDFLLRQPLFVTLFFSLVTESEKRGKSTFSRYALFKRPVTEALHTHTHKKNNNPDAEKWKSKRKMVCHHAIYTQINKVGVSAMRVYFVSNQVVGRYPSAAGLVKIA